MLRLSRNFRVYFGSDHCPTIRTPRNRGLVIVTHGRFLPAINIP